MGWDHSLSGHSGAVRPTLPAHYVRDWHIASNEWYARDVRNLGPSGLSSDAQSTRMTRSGPAGSENVEVMSRNDPAPIEPAYFPQQPLLRI